MITKAAHVLPFILPFHRRVCGLQSIHCTYHHGLPSRSSSRPDSQSRIPPTTIVSHQSIEVIEAKGPPAVKVTMKRSREAVRYGGHSDEATLIHELLGLPDAPTEGEDRIGENAVANVVRHIQARLPQSEYVSSVIGRGAGRGLCCGACRRSGPIPMAPFPPDLTSRLLHLARASG